MAIKICFGQNFTEATSEHKMLAESLQEQFGSLYFLTKMFFDHVPAFPLSVKQENLQDQK